MTEETPSVQTEAVPVDKNIAIVENALSEQSEPETQETENQESEKAEEQSSEDVEKRKIEKGYERQRKRADRNLFKYEQQRARADAAERRLAELTAQRQARGSEPKEEDFEDYGSFLRAVARHEARQENDDLQIKSVEAEVNQARGELSASEQERIAELRSSFDESAERASKAFPDFESVINQYAPPGGQSPFSPAAVSALRESDNAPFGLYSILKEGLIDEFNSLSAINAAGMLALHAEKALSQSKPRKISNAPEPITAARGNGHASKDPSQMTDSEYEAYYRKRKYQRP